MGQASDKNTGRPEAPTEVRERTREAESPENKLRRDTGSPGEQREVRKTEDERLRKALEKTQEFPPSEQLLAMLQQAKKSGPDAGQTSKSDAQAPGADAGTLTAGSDKTREVKEAQLPETAQSVDKPRLSAASEAIWKGTAQDSYVRSADPHAILTTLRDNTKTETERQYLQADYASKHGQTMEEGLKKTLSDSDFKRAQDYLNGKAHGDKRDVSDVTANLKEMGQWTGPRSSVQVETDLKEMVASKTPAELKKLDADFKQENKDGQSFREAIADDPNLSRQTKETIAAYMDSTRDAQGRLSSDDTQKLAGVALKYGDSASLTSVMKGASPEARQRFFAEGGQEKMQEMLRDPFERKLLQATPGQDRKWSTGEYMHALEIAQNGELSAATKIRDNTGRFSNNDKAIDTALQDMKPEQRKLYLEGKEMAASGRVDESSKAYKYYQDLRAAIDDSTRFSAKRESLDEKAIREGGGIKSLIADRHAGITNDGADKIAATMANLSQKDFDLYKNDQKYQNEVRQFLKETMKLPESDVNQVTKPLDQAKDYQEYKINAQAGKVSDQIPLGRQVAEKGSNVWDNKQEFLRDFLKEPAEKRQELLKSSLGEKVTGPLSEEQRQVLDRLSKSETPQPSDLVRAHVVGLGVSKEELTDRLSKLSPDQKEQLKSDYATNYKVDALTDLSGSKTGVEREKWVDLLKRPAASTDEAMFDIRKQAVQSRVSENGLVDSWDGTRHMAQERYNRIREDFVQGKAKGEINPKSEAPVLQKMQDDGEKLFADRQRLVESRQDVASAAVSGVTTVVGLGAAGMTVKGLMAGGALLKAGMQEAVVGSDGDTSTTGRVGNLVTGAAEAGLLKFAPGAGAAETSFARKATENVAVAMVSTMPGVAADTVRNWDANKSVKENTQAGLERGAVSIATAGGTALGFSMAHAAGGAVLKRVSQLRGEVPVVHSDVATAGNKTHAGGEHPALARVGNAPEAQLSTSTASGATHPDLPVSSGDKNWKEKTVKPGEGSVREAQHGIERTGHLSDVSSRRSGSPEKVVAAGDNVVYKGDGQKYTVRAEVDKNGLVLSHDTPAGVSSRKISDIPDNIKENFPEFKMDGRSYFRNQNGQVFELKSTLNKMDAKPVNQEQLAQYVKSEIGGKDFYQSPRSGKFYELHKSGSILVGSSGPELHLDPNLRFASRARVEKALPAAEALAVKPAAAGGVQEKISSVVPDRATAPLQESAPPPTQRQLDDWQQAKDKLVRPSERPVTSAPAVHDAQAERALAGKVTEVPIAPKAAELDKINLENQIRRLRKESRLLNDYAETLEKHNDPAKRKVLEEQLRENGMGKLVAKDDYSNKDIKEVRKAMFNKHYKSVWAAENLEALDKGLPPPIHKDTAPPPAAIREKPSRTRIEGPPAHFDGPETKEALQRPVKPGNRQASEALHEGSPPENVNRKVERAADTPGVKPPAAAEVDSAKKIADLQGKAQRFDEQGALLLQYAQALKNETAKGPEARHRIEELLREKGLKELIVSQNKGERTAKQVLNQAQNKWRLADWAKQAVKQFEQDST